MTDNAERQKESEYLREAVRLAELRLEQQQRTDEINQRKAVWLITFCLITAGYLYTEGPDAERHCLPVVVWGAGRAVLGAVLFAATACAVLVVNVAYWKVHGVEPHYTMNEYFGEQYSGMARDLLRNYGEFFGNNLAVLNKKGKYLLWGRNLGLLGAAFSFVLIWAEDLACIAAL